MENMKSNQTIDTGRVARGVASRANIGIGKEAKPNLAGIAETGSMQVARLQSLAGRLQNVVDKLGGIRPPPQTSDLGDPESSNLMGLLHDQVGERTRGLEFLDSEISALENLIG